jgi:hypothetical protein
MAWQRPLAADEARHHPSTGPVYYVPNLYGPPVYYQPTLQFRSTFQPQPTSHTAVSVSSPVPSSGIREATSIQARQASPKTECDTILYVNPKQFQRILKRRRLRQVLGLSAGNQRKSYIHESRHRHAANRPRGPDGKFLSAGENAALDSNRKRKADWDSENDVDSKKGFRVTGFLRNG